MFTLENLLKDNKLMPKSKPAFRKHRIYIDGLPDDMTKAGHEGYTRLVHLLYDIAKLLNDNINKNAIHRIIDELDFITTQNYYEITEEHDNEK